ncbi:MAG TPA: serine/threonine-protein kinase, partial [Anaerolineae bacterium]|nr:serine/threonine-protein kinase [Anaerolineae bacterium]
MEELIGKELGQYRIEAKLGEGGMASVFKAYQPSLNRYVAIKVLPPHFVAKDPSFSKRFQREAEAIARLQHPNILPVYDFGIDQNYSYLVMRYVEGGQTLNEALGLSLSMEQIISLISQVAHALAYAHQHGVIHRDVKPSNVLLDRDWVLLSDFGLAKISESAGRITDTGKSMGTPAYMSPEQVQGAEIDCRSDIYSLGIILYELLTATLPHQAPTPIATMFKRASEPPASPRTLNSAIPESIERVILRCLAIRPEERYDSATDFAAALRQAMGINSNEETIIDPTGKKTFIFDAPVVTKPDLERNLATKTSSKIGRNSIWFAGGIISIAVLALILLLSGNNPPSLPATPQAEAAQTAPAVAIAPTATSTPTSTPTWTPTPTPLPPTATPSFTPPPTHTPVPPT